MMQPRKFLCCLLALVLAACATPVTEQHTLGELDSVEADVTEIYLDDSLERAAQSYRRYLEETDRNARTPEAMRRLADLQIEQAYGVIGSDAIVEVAAPDMTAPQAAAPLFAGEDSRSTAAPDTATESEQEFERRATQRELLVAGTVDLEMDLPGVDSAPVPSGPREAIKTYQMILEQYPNYERNDKVLYQMSRAYDEIGQPDEAMAVMDRLVAQYPYSKYVDEVYFRRGEYYFVRRKYFDAEDAYGAIVKMGPTSSYYELALYKLGWTLYKQELYEEALQNYMAMLDYRLSIGYDFESDYDENDEHRVADTFRVISLSFSNLGGPEVVDEYFAKHGRRSFADKIYGNLGEFYFSKLRYEDAASVLRSFVSLNPYHRVSPHFSMRIVDFYREAGFPLLVVEAKKQFATDYALDAEYWNYFNVEDASDVVGFLQTNLTDLADHYHALYQNAERPEERPQSFAEAQRWYRQYLYSFPQDGATPAVNYRLGDLLLENEDFGAAAIEYERTAYDYAPHEQSAAAGYAAVYAHRQNLAVVTGARRLEVNQATIASSLRFAEAFPQHEEAPVVLGAAADDLYELQQFEAAIAAAQKLIERYPGSDTSLLRSAWAVIAYSSIDLAEYANAEHAYMNLLALTAADSAERPAVVDGLAAAIYKQGEQANLLGDFQLAATHFLRVKDVAPDSAIRTAAEYDAAAALIKLQDWTHAASVLEEFRVSHPDHELHVEATKQLANIYREDGQISRSAAEHERIAAEAVDPELARAATLTAAEMYDEVADLDEAIRVYESYVESYPRPLDIAMETRTRLADIFKMQLDYARYHAQLDEIVTADREAGIDRSDRSRYLAAKAALVLATLVYERFADLDLVQPFEKSLAEKQKRMDAAMQAFEDLIGYEVAEVTAGATYYLAEIYMEFSTALLESERPGGLSEAEKVDYELVIEEEAYPFEERAIEVHEQNFELLAAGIYNSWVQQSLDKLAVLMPGRYAKNEISGGFLKSIDTFAYRMPIAPQLGIDEDGSNADGEPQQASPEATAQAVGGPAD